MKKSTVWPKGWSKEKRERFKRLDRDGKTPEQIHRMLGPSLRVCTRLCKDLAYDRKWAARELEQRSKLPENSSLSLVEINYSERRKYNASKPQMDGAVKKMRTCLLGRTCNHAKFESTHSGDRYCPTCRGSAELSGVDKQLA